MTTVIEEDVDVLDIPETHIEFVDQSEVALIDYAASDIDVAMAAWVSNHNDLPPDMKASYHMLKNGWSGYEDDWKRIEGLINFLYRERHMTPFEHGFLKFRIDCPIFVSREFMRHRTFSYNESSSRYKDLEPRFFLIDSERPLSQVGTPGKYRFGPGTDEQYGVTFASTALAYTAAWEAYQNMLRAGVAREVARNVLPLGIMTQFYVSGNPRNWMQFLLLRDDPNALKEIRDIAQKIDTKLESIMPLTHKAFKKYDWRSDRVELDALRKKVAQHEAEETYRDNINFEPDMDW